MKTKRILAVILSVLMLLSVVPLTASAAAVVASGTCGNNVTWSLDSDGVLTIAGTGDMTNYSSSSSAPWCSNYSSIKKVVIADGVTSIGNEAFYYDNYIYSLTSITIPDSVTSIGGWAIGNCTSLTSITFGDNSQLTSIGDYAFYNCANLTSITIPDSVTSIGDYAFYNCANLTSITIPDSVTSIGAGAFDNCTRLTSITFGDNSQLTSIGSSAFRSCNSLASITIPHSVTNIGNSAFFSCKNLANITVAEDNENYCSDRFGILFNKDKTQLIQYPIGNARTSYTIPDSVTSIGNSAFRNCTNLTSITIPDNITSIAFTAFYSCPNLASIAILNPDCVISDHEWTIGHNAVIYGYTGSTAQAYAEKYNRTFVALDPHTHSYTSIVTLPATCCTTGVMTYTCECEDSYTEVIPFDFNNHTGGTEVRDAKAPTSTEEGYTGDTYCLGCNTKIANGESIPYTPEIIASGTCGKNVTWSLDSDGVLTIAGTGDMTKYSYSSVPWRSNRSAIKTVIIENGVTSIGAYAFRDCTSLTSVTIGDSVTSIGDYAFYKCDSLTSVTIPDSVTSIGEWAFYYCTSLTSVTIPDSVTSIGDYAFSCCTALTSVHISDIAAWCNIDFDGFDANPLHYAHNLYLNGTLVTTLTIPDSVTSIGDHAFQECTSLTSVTIPDSVTSIGDWAFEDCTSLTSVTFSANSRLTSIGHSAFSGCRSLTSVTIPDSVTSIGAFAFSSCTSLTSVTIPDSVTSIGEFAFSSCTSLTSVTILNPDCEIYDSEFTICDTATIYGYADSTAQAYAEKYGRTFVALVPPHSHSYTASVTAPTCTAQGYTTYTCECGDSYVSDYTDKLDHSYTSEITTPATHLTEGVETFTCECGDSYTKPVAKLEGHTYISVVTAPTCTAKGHTTYTCECGDSYVADYVGVIPHSFTKYVSDNNATCKADGTKHAFCDYNCGAKDVIVDEGSRTEHIDNDNDGYCDIDSTELYEHHRCMCHNSNVFIRKFFYPVALFFWKLFGIRQTCECGKVHY